MSLWGKVLLLVLYINISYQYTPNLLRKYPKLSLLASQLQNEAGPDQALAVAMAAVRNEATRSEALENVMNLSIEEFTPNPGESKALLAACAAEGYTDIVEAILNRLQDANLFNSELLYVGIRFGCRKHDWKLAWNLLSIACKLGIAVDLESVNSVIHSCTMAGRLDEAMHVLEQVHSGSFIPDVQGDIATYSMVIACAGRAQNRSQMMRVFDMIRECDHVSPDERTYLAALNTCSFSGDFVSAAEIFSLYEKSFGLVQTRAYAMLLISFVSSASDRRKFASPDESSTIDMDSRNTSSESESDCASASASASENESGIESKIPREVLTPESEAAREASLSHLGQVVQFLIRSNLDSSLTLANLILQYYCVIDDIVLADAYFLRMTLQLAHRPSTKAMVEFSHLIFRANDRQRASSLHEYMAVHLYSPFPELVRLSLDRAHEIGDVDRTLDLLQNAHQGDAMKIEWFYKALLLCLDFDRHEDAMRVLSMMVDALRAGRISDDCHFILSAVEHTLYRVPFALWQGVFPDVLALFKGMEEAKFRGPDGSLVYSKDIDATTANSADELFVSERKRSYSELVPCPRPLRTYGGAESETESSSSPSSRQVKLDKSKDNVRPPTLQFQSWRHYRAVGYSVIIDALVRAEQFEMADDMLQAFLKEAQVNDGGDNTDAERQNVGIEITAPLKAAILVAIKFGKATVGNSDDFISSVTSEADAPVGFSVSDSLVTAANLRKQLALQQGPNAALTTAMLLMTRLVGTKHIKMDNGFLTVAMRGLARSAIQSPWALLALACEQSAPQPPSPAVINELLRGLVWRGTWSMALRIFDAYLQLPGAAHAAWENDALVDTVGKCVRDSRNSEYARDMVTHALKSFFAPSTASNTPSKNHGRTLSIAVDTLIACDSNLTSTDVRETLRTPTAAGMEDKNTLQDILPDIAPSLMLLDLRHHRADKAVQTFLDAYPENDPPNPKALSPLDMALKAMNDERLGALFAKRFAPHLHRIHRRVESPVLTRFVRYASISRDVDTAVAYLLFKHDVQVRRLQKALRSVNAPTSVTSPGVSDGAGLSDGGECGDRDKGAPRGPRMHPSISLLAVCKQATEARRPDLLLRLLAVYGHVPEGWQTMGAAALVPNVPVSGSSRGSASGGGGDHRKGGGRGRAQAGVQVLPRPPARLVASTIASLALSGLFTRAIELTETFLWAVAAETAENMEDGGSLEGTPFWGFTFVLLACAGAGRGSEARAVLQHFKAALPGDTLPPALAYNLALLAVLKDMAYGSEYMNEPDTQHNKRAQEQTLPQKNKNHRDDTSTLRGQGRVEFSPEFVRARAGEAAALLIDMASGDIPLHPSIADMDLSDVGRAFGAFEGSDNACSEATELITRPLKEAMRRLKRPIVSSSSCPSSIASEPTSSPPSSSSSSSSPSLSPKFIAQHVDFSNEQMDALDLIGTIVNPAVAVPRPSKQLLWSVSKAGLTEADNAISRTSICDYGRHPGAHRTPPKRSAGHTRDNGKNLNHHHHHYHRHKKDGIIEPRRYGKSGRSSAQESSFSSPTPPPPPSSPRLSSSTSSSSSFASVDTRTNLLEENLRQMDRNALLNHGGRIVKNRSGSEERKG